MSLCEDAGAGARLSIGDQARNELVAVKRISAVRRLTSTSLVFDWDPEMYGEGMDPTQRDGYRPRTPPPRPSP